MDLPFRKVNTLEVCGVVHLGTPEARNSEVNLDHPNQQATWRQISHFGDSTLWRIAVLANKNSRMPEFQRIY
jgi:hypothetical protein